MEKEYSTKYLQLNRDKTIVFDASCMPFYSVTPELSDLAESEVLKRQFMKQFSNLTFDQASIIDGAVILQDILLPKNVNSSIFLQEVKKLNNETNITLQIIDGEQATQKMINQLYKQNTLSKKPTIILPGKGALAVAKQIEKIDPTLLSDAYSVSLQRTMIKPGTFEITFDENQIPMEENMNSFLIIDDVVASGKTAKTIANAIYKRNPNANVNLATWLYLWPTDKTNLTSPSGIADISCVTTTFAVKGNYVSRPPINSLSCFFATDQQSQEKIKNYVNKYVRRSDSFTTQINTLKGWYE